MPSKQTHRSHYWFGILFSAVCAVAACGDDEDGRTTSTQSNMPTGSGGTASGAGGGMGMPAGGANAVGNAAGQGSGTAPSGAGEAPGIIGGLGTAGAMAAGASTDPACLTDADGDGVSDCLDGCPADPNKREAGACGCGVIDVDLDADGTLDCQEMCPGDPAKTAPGACGCGLPDVDSDGDGTLDCDESCPFEATRLAPGTCGCAADTLALCLRHRYSFNGTGDVATDTVGAADGTIVNTTLTGAGSLTLAGLATDQYVNLPAGIISGLGPSATIEAWVTWTGAGGPWQRIFDFGSSELAAGQQGTGVTYLFLSPSNTIDTHLRAAFTNAGPPAERVASGPTILPFAVPIHVAIVIDGATQTLTLYQGGALVGTAPTLDTTLALMNDVNNWLGRSQFAADEEFQGVIDEVRIYSAARNAAQIAAEVAAGPNALPAN
ncbi:MAG: LamG-like jellyroll fold domain-containing protein [Deltaproteobacteria bacterium]